jgi:hypothetical protein
MDSVLSVSPVNTLAPESKNIPSTSTVAHTAASTLQAIYCQALYCLVLNFCYYVWMWHGMWDSEDGLHRVEVTEVDSQVLSSGVFYEQTKAVIDCRLCALNSGYLTSMHVQNTKEIPSLHYIWTNKKANWAWDLLFWNVTQQRLVVTDVWGLPIRATFKTAAIFLDCLTLEDWTDRLPQTLVIDCLSVLLNVPEEQDLIYSTGEAWSDTIWAYCKVWFETE